MKKQLLIGLLGAAGGLGLASSMASCDDYRPTTGVDGKLLVAVNLDKDVVASASNKQASPHPAPRRSRFQLPTCR